MMPINNFNNIKVKMYATSKGIKVIDSPIKIQILNILDKQTSEADIVSSTGKSKSTISVHLKNLIDDGVISYKSHPMDRRSKLFHIVAKFIGEVYPDKIIYGTPEVNPELNSREDLSVELFRQYKSLLLYNGLQLGPLEESLGEKIGSAIYDSLEYNTLTELLNQLKIKFDELGWGKIKIKTKDTIIIKIKDCHECSNLQYNLPLCNVTKGILKGIFSSYLNKTVSVEEVECVSNHDDSCTFIIDF